MRLGDLDALKKEFALLMWKEHNPYDTVKVCDIVNQALDFIDNAPTVNDDLLNYINQSIEAEQKAMADCHDLNSEDYHKGIIYAFECMKMKLM